MIDGEVISNRVSESATLTLYGHLWLLDVDTMCTIWYFWEDPLNYGGPDNPPATGQPGELIATEIYEYNWNEETEEWEIGDFLGYAIGLCGGDGIFYWWGDIPSWSFYTGRPGVLYELAIVQETGQPESYLALCQGGTSWSALQLWDWYPDP